MPEREEHRLTSNAEERLEKIVSRLDRVEQRLLVLEGQGAEPRSGEAPAATSIAPQPPATALLPPSPWPLTAVSHTSRG